MISAIRSVMAFIFLGLAWYSSAQRVTVSKEMVIRNDFAYDVIGMVDENILLYRDKGNERVVEVFDKNLKHLFEREIILETNKADIYAIVPQDTVFSVIYGYRKKKYYNIDSKAYEVMPGAEEFIILDNYRDKTPIHKR